MSIAFLALFFAVQEPPSARVGQVHAELIGCRLVAREVRCELTVRNTGSADGEARIWSARAVTPTGRVAEAQAFTFGTARSRPYFGARQIMPSGVPMAVTIVFRSDTDPSGLAMLGVTVELAPDRRGELQFRDVPIER